MSKSSKNKKPDSKGSKQEAGKNDLQKKVVRLAKKRSSIFIYKIGRFIIRRFGHKYFRLYINDKTNLNLKGRFIIAPVHRSNLDAPLLNSCSNRRINSLAKIAMFKSRFSLRLSAIIGCIPLDRDTSDRQGMELALEVLERDEPLMLFPEGLRSKGVKVEKIFGGCAFLAIKANAPVVPIGIYGTQEPMPPKKKFPKRGFVSIEVGDVIYPPKKISKATRDEMTEKIHSEMQRLLDLAHENSTGRKNKTGRKQKKNN